MSESSLPNRARIIIVGGGVGGTSVAYHLTQLGERDILLIDRSELTSGSTFHSAGLVGQLRADPTLTAMNMHSVSLYRELEKSDTPPGWRECGSIKIASTPERMAEIRRQIGWAKNFGLDLHEISPAQVKELFPLIDLEGVIGACFMPSDGQVDPSQLAYAMASGARRAGAKIATNTRLLSISTVNNRINGIETDKGFIECEILINCGGMYAAEIGRMAGVRVPLIPMSHQYLITENFLEQGAPLMPSLRDPDNLIYFRQEVSGLLMGGYERNSAPWSASSENLDAIPRDFNSKLLPEDWERFEEIATHAQRRVPIMNSIGIKNFINGPEGFTPDNEFILGESEVHGFYLAAGFCAHGIAGAGGIGKVIAEWVIAGEPTMDLWHMDIRRFHSGYDAPDYTVARVQENYEAYYDIHYPGEERQTMRPHRTSPIYSWHKERGAVFGEKFGWERVNYYAHPDAAKKEALRPQGWAGVNWSPEVAIEHHATRNAAGLYDESSFGKIAISGERAGEFLNYVAANNILREKRAVYTQLLNSRGGIEADVTITQISDGNFILITGTASARHDKAWLEKIAEREGFSVTITDVSQGYAVFSIWGPRAREIMAPITDIDLSHDAFGFGASREAIIAGVKVRMVRITYVGELGWEIYIPRKDSEDPLKVWQVIFDAGAPLGLLPCGYRAIESLRLEKGYRAWGGEISTERNPLEAGLSFAVSMKKERFLGRDAIAELKERGAPAKRLVAITFDDITRVPIGKEPISFGGKVIAQMKSGGQGFSINKSIGYAYLPSDISSGATVEVEFFGEKITGELSLEALFDPTNSRILS
jgi:4-methylaminobutanoate oxidase (formaldehyde-forming)